jgi:hypothetical protein
LYGREAGWSVRVLGEAQCERQLDRAPVPIGLDDVLVDGDLIGDARIDGLPMQKAYAFVKRISRDRDELQRQTCEIGRDRDNRVNVQLGHKRYRKSREIERLNGVNGLIRRRIAFE